MNTPDPIKVMIVDDSSIVRMVLSKAIENDPELKLVESSKNGKIAVERIPIVQPDAIILDIEMPELDGFGVLKAIRASFYKTRVIMFSTLSERGASKTLEALSLGACDYVLKPTSSQDIQKVSSDVIQKVKQFFTRNTKPAGPVAPPASALKKPASTKAELIAIGTSTGGPVALSKVIPEITADCKTPILIVQHMPPVFTEQLARQLDHYSSLTVLEAKDHMNIEPGHVYVAPGDYHMRVKRVHLNYQIALSQDPPENYCRPSVDVTFRSLADTYKNHILAIIMTGMGKDGLLGTQRLKEINARIFAQNEETCVVYGMPSYIVENQLADEVLPLEDIPQRINELCLKV